MLLVGLIAVLFVAGWLIVASNGSFWVILGLALAGVILTKDY